MISIHLFTRDLRSTDNPGFAAACEGGEVVPVFVLDDRCLKGVHASANRVAFLLESLTDLRLTLRSLGGELLVRRGSPARVVAGLAGSIGPVRVTVAEDVTSFSSRRERELRMALRSGGSGADDILQTHPGVTVVPVEAVRTVGGRAYRVFTPYWRAWTEAPRREVLRPPEVVRVPEGLDPGEIPSLEELVPGAAPGKRLEGGETAGRQRMLAWLADRGADYRIGDESLSDEDSSSRLGAYLHFG
ncbi:MAG: deoxyribodipyrimidine photo-lyase, partial [Actinobacteria bacterium ATB1]|nr:deoxyribodipyrimidine photo-lyase [Actinobacteria bacterium ATB1]